MTDHKNSYTATLARNGVSKTKGFTNSVSFSSFKNAPYTVYSTTV
ncbi:hypothetical protein [Maribacter sp. MMG018]|nr:hypothetical protein [Maribacter sp. MMG018]